MVIEINGERKFGVSEDFLIVKDKRLYNVKTKKFEGVDGDIVEFVKDENGKKMSIRGTVDGYTCGNHIKIRGVSDYESGQINDIRIEHISTVSYEDSVSAEEKELDIAQGAL
jgi:hypothetical protein